jgi:hypothetical protein
MKIPAAFQPYAEVFQVLDGYGQLWSPSGQFLGLLSSQADNTNSIINLDGEYGSPFSLSSIHNPQCQYGGEKGKHSPFNPNCNNPPIVLFRNQPIFVLSSNFNLYTNGLKIIEPLLVLGIYEAFADLNSQPLPQSLRTVSQPPATPEQLRAKLRPLSGKLLMSRIDD